jgi:vacuolar-type H+-ATPase subunit I/STV1
MSLIISLNEAGNVICFSNEYASFSLGTSISSVKRDLKRLKDLGYITTTSSNQTRKIKVLTRPKVLDFSVEECEITEAQNELVEAQNEPAQNTQRLNMSQQVAQYEPAAGSNRATYKIEYKKEDKIDVAGVKTTTQSPLDFLIKEFNEVSRVSECFQVWENMTEENKQSALEMVEATKQYQREKNMTYDLYYYLTKPVWGWGTIRTINKKLNQQKNVKKDLSPQEKGSIFTSRYITNKK